MELNRNKDREEYLKDIFELQQKLKEYEKLDEKEKEELRKNYGAKNYSENDLKGEIWKEYPRNPKYLISNKGRVKYEGKIQKQKDDEKPHYFTLADESLLKYYIYELVAFTFLGKDENDGYHIHHITNDGYDNSTDNLILLTQYEHSLIHGFLIGRKR